MYPKDDLRMDDMHKYICTYIEDTIDARFVYG